MRNQSSPALREYLEALPPDRRRKLGAETVAELDTDLGPSRRADLDRLVRLVDEVGDWDPGQMTFQIGGAS